MIIKKIVPGFVIQDFDTEKKEFVSQEFILCNDDSVCYETEVGEPIDPTKAESYMEDSRGNEKYLPFEMVQPDELDLIHSNR